MKLVLSDAKLLKDAVAIISELVTEARFNCTQEAVALTALDPATVAMIDFKLLASALSEYDVKGEEDFSVNLMNFKQVLRRCGNSDTVELETQEAKLKVTIRGSSTRTFHLPLIELDDQKRQLPGIDYSVTVTCNSQQFADAIDDADIVAESVALLGEDKIFTVRAEGDLSKVNIEIPQDDNTKIVVAETAGGEKVIQPVRARYSIEYLKKMVQGGKLADKVTIKFRQDHPLNIEFKVLNKVFLAFVLAPRVEND